ncbi:TPA: hypothetical protein QDA91_003107 [Burkholderia vietnamiensis]|uniref:Uncharacterized protein n=1 Tax=Burkholderia vietnamiensis TaxID=60552 RepID=A0AA45BC22_BURVI|nr:hypothetical protein [Burkholderia vietnamiensis]KVR89495.1 hypothetical protein WK28_24095 [Burkholderia vietnamiensis]PRH40407.1 hypothetical protein C6T65_20960 [Burkholderia vietnamiensis]HDR9131982.1 hypothetical protein [Burkholderia vietnamiensis]
MVILGNYGALLRPDIGGTVSKRFDDIEDLLYEVECLVDEVQAMRMADVVISESVKSTLLDRLAVLVDFAEKHSWPPVGTKPEIRLRQFQDWIKEAADDFRHRLLS